MNNQQTNERSTDEFPKLMQGYREELLKFIDGFPSYKCSILPAWRVTCCECSESSVQAEYDKAVTWLEDHMFVNHNRRTKDGN